MLIITKTEAIGNTQKGTGDQGSGFGEEGVVIASLTLKCYYSPNEVILQKSWCFLMILWLMNHIRIKN